MKRMIAACVLATLFAASLALAVDRPPNPQQPKGTEGPDVQHSRPDIPGGPDWPYVR